MAAGGLTVEFETLRFELTNNLPVSETGEAANLRGDHNHVVLVVRSARQIRFALALAARFD